MDLLFSLENCEKTMVLSSQAVTKLIVTEATIADDSEAWC